MASRVEEAPESDSTDKELEDILAQALKEPSVAEAIEFYERVERIYGSALSPPPQPVEQTTNSANA